MTYLLDTNTLIQAKNDYYAFKLCPGFWDWLSLAHGRGTVLSIDSVLKELRTGQDDLFEWAAKMPASFFAPIDSETLTQFARVAKWVQERDFREEAKHEFLSKADPLLISYALAHGHTLVTHEVHAEGAVRKVKIPTVCRALGVRTLRTFKMLTDAGARFVLAP
jgi:hypothetical protein